MLEVGWKSFGKSFYTFGYLRKWSRNLRQSSEVVRRSFEVVGSLRKPLVNLRKFRFCADEKSHPFYWKMLAGIHCTSMKEAYRNKMNHSNSVRLKWVARYWVIPENIYTLPRGHEYFNPLLPSAIPKCSSSRYPLNSKITKPCSPPEFSFFSDPLEFLLDHRKRLANRKLALFPLQNNSVHNFRSDNQALKFVNVSTP